MSDKVLDTSQLVSGAAILLSFFVGYKYALRNQSKEGSLAAGGTPTAAPEPSARWDDNGEYKMVLVVRNDLKMGKGKIAAQCGHGAVGAYQSGLSKYPNLVRQWEYSGCAKIAVKCESEAEMKTLRAAAQNHNLNTCLIRDAGRTQIKPNSITVLAIGPAPVHELDKITGHLKLL